MKKLSADKTLLDIYLTLKISAALCFKYFTYINYLVVAFNPDVICLLWYHYKEFSFIGSFPLIPCIYYEHKVIFISNDYLMLISKS